MLDLQSHPYFCGLLDIQQITGGAPWIVRIAGSFPSTPNLYVFRKRNPNSGPSTGVGMTLYDAAGACIFSTTDSVLAFTGVPEVPPIYELTVPANNSGSITITGADQQWTPAVALPTNALVWYASRQIAVTEVCYNPPKPGAYEKVVREWATGICRASSTDLMVRLLTRSAFSHDQPGSETYYGDQTSGQSYGGHVFIADKSMVI
jgi:hypothetical protein